MPLFRGEESGVLKSSRRGAKRRGSLSSLIRLSPCIRSLVDTDYRLRPWPDAAPWWVNFSIRFHGRPLVLLTILNTI